MQREKFITICLLMMLAVLVGSVYAADWPQFRGDDFHSGRTSEILQPPLKVKWTYQANDKIVSSPSVENGIVYFGSRDNYIYALNVLDGSVKWKYKAGNWVDSSPVIAEASVVFSSRDGNVYALNKEDGSLIWKYNSGGTDSSSPVISGQTVYGGAGFPQKYIYAVNLADGREVWKKETGQMVYSSPAISGRNVIIGSNDGYVYSLDKDSGEESWRFKTKGGVDYSSPALDADTLYMASGEFDWSVYAVNIQNGKSVWEHELGDQELTPNYISSVAVGNDEVFMVSGYEQQHIYCLKKEDGSQKWKAALSESTRFGFSSSPVLTDNTVYVASSKGTLFALNIATGAIEWQYDLKADVLSSVTISDGHLFIGTLDGKMIAFN